MPAVIRTRLIWSMYAVNGVSAFFVYSVGPATPLIADDLGIPAQIAALHGTAMALAMLTAGAVAEPVVRRLGRRSALVSAVLAMAVGVLVVVLAPVLVVSLLGAFLAGCSGSVAAVAANATLADSDPVLAPTILTEANAAAGWSGLFAPLFMGAFLLAGLGWRLGLAVAIPMCLVLAAFLRRGPAAPSAARPAVPMSGVTSSRGAYPRVFWLVLVAVFCAAGAEFAVNYWGASLMLEQVTGNKGVVTAVMSAPVAGVAIGRTLGARLALRSSPHVLLLGGFVLATAGFAVFWAASIVVMAGLGLLVTGLGLSVLYPLLLDRAAGVLVGRSDRAMAWCVGFAGAAIGLAPFGLGTLAQGVGVSRAFLVVPVFCAVGFIAVAASRPGAGVVAGEPSATTPA